MDTECTLRVCADRASAIEASTRKDILSLLNPPRHICGLEDWVHAHSVAACGVEFVHNTYHNIVTVQHEMNSIFRPESGGHSRCMSVVKTAVLLPYYRRTLAVPVSCLSAAITLQTLTPWSAGKHGTSKCCLSRLHHTNRAATFRTAVPVTDTKQAPQNVKTAQLQGRARNPSEWCLAEMVHG